MLKCFRISSILATAALLSSTFTACDFLGLSGPSGPGEIHASLLATHGEFDGAAVIELTGLSEVPSIRCDDGQVFSQHDGTTTRVVIVLDDPGLLAFRMRVSDVSDIPTLTVVQVADGNNDLRASVSGYEVEWSQIADSDRSEHRSAQ